MYMYEIFSISGANVNCSSPIIGSPLHVACSDNIPNRFEILTVCSLPNYSCLFIKLYFLIKIENIIDCR